MRPLDGITVIDLTRLLPGAAATMLLSNFGADVIKIEQPGQGDYARRIPPLVDGEGAVFRATNRGKRSFALDLKSADGKAALREMVANADVLLEGFRPGAMGRLGLDYPALRAVNERLIYVSLTGYGQTGPYAAMAGHDINYIALSGLLGVTGAIPGVQIADLAGGSLQAVIGILLALMARHKTGRGQYVDVSMLEGAACSLHGASSSISCSNGRVPGTGCGDALRPVRLLPNVSRCRRPLACRRSTRAEVLGSIVWEVRLSRVGRRSVRRGRPPSLSDRNFAPHFRGQVIAGVARLVPRRRRLRHVGSERRGSGGRPALALG